MQTNPFIARALFLTCLLPTAACDGDDDMSASMAMPDAGMMSTTGTPPEDSTGATPDDATTHGDSMDAATTTGMVSTTSEDTMESEASSSSGEAVETAGHSDRFEDIVTGSGMQALLDLETNLLWVNDVNACSPLGAPNDNTAMLAMQYCDDLVFQGHEDWRMPTADEAGELITAALEEAVDLVYQNPGCPAVITMGGVAVETHNGDNPGDVTEMPPSLGIRCVRMNG